MGKKNRKKTNQNYMEAEMSALPFDDKDDINKVVNIKKVSTNSNTSNNSNVTTPIVSTYSYNHSWQKNKKPYEYKGVKNQTQFPEFVNLCKKTQDELKQILPQRLLDAGYTDVVVGDGYIYTKGELPILLTAHMDTVHKAVVQDFYEHVNAKGQHVLASPQGIGGDDRCGIYMILEIIKEFKPSVLFCEDEEIGGVGSDKFCKTDLIMELSELNYLIELDRANAKDAVFYDCDNEEFTEFIESNTGYHEEWGSFSDISTLAPLCGVAAVNLSCGYYHAHSLEEEVVVEEMLNTIEVVKKLLTVECKQFEYIEAYYNRKYHSGYSGYAGYNYSGYAGRHGASDNYDDWCDDERHRLYIEYFDYKVQDNAFDVVKGRSEEHAWLKFFIHHSHICMDDIVDFYSV